MQGLHAQATKLKAYSVSELDSIDTAAQAAYLPGARKAIEAHHGKALRTAAGRVVAPKERGYRRVGPERDKSYKLIRRYVVETER
jgi:hypothetical protein